MDTQTIINKAVEENVKLMGDDFIGFKFVGEGASFYNQLLVEAYNEGEEVGEFMNTEWLDDNEIPYVEYDSETWQKEGI